MFNKQRLNVHLYVTPLCNLKCKHCYYNSKPSTESVSRLLSISEMAQVITDLSDEYAVAFDVEGGEFFLREDIIKLFEEVPVHYWKNVTITTNGTIDIRVPSYYLRLIDEFRVSVEGHTDDLQYDVRGIGLTPILDTCSKLQEDNVPVTLRITLHKKNYLYIPELLMKFTSLGFMRFSFYEFQSVGRGYCYKGEYSLKDKEIEYVLSTLNRELDGIEILKLSLSAKRIPIVRKHQKQLIASGYKVEDISGVPSLTVDYNGSLGICPWSIEQPGIGSFKRESFKRDIAEFLQKNILSHQCIHCTVIRIITK